MVELNLEHFLILSIAIFLLYHFVSRCNCFNSFSMRSGNSFSVGGQVCGPNSKCGKYLKKTCGDTLSGEHPQFYCYNCTMNGSGKEWENNGCTENDIMKWCEGEKICDHSCDEGDYIGKYSDDGLTPCKDCTVCDNGSIETHECKNNSDTICEITNPKEQTCPDVSGKSIEDRAITCFSKPWCFLNASKQCVNVDSYNDSISDKYLTSWGVDHFKSDYHSKNGKWFQYGCQPAAFALKELDTWNEIDNPERELICNTFSENNPISGEGGDAPNSNIKCIYGPNHSSGACTSSAYNNTCCIRTEPPCKKETESCWSLGGDPCCPGFVCKTGNNPLVGICLRPDSK